MEYRVVITSDAEADLDGFLRYLLLILLNNMITVLYRYFKE